MGTIDRLRTDATDLRTRNFPDRKQATFSGYCDPAPVACPEHGEDHALSEHGQYRTTTICGSMRFFPHMLDAAKQLSRERYVVIMPFVTFSAGEQLSDPDKKMLDDMHFYKISISDEIHVVTVGGYVGESTRREIEFAKRAGKAVTTPQFLRPRGDGMTGHHERLTVTAKGYAAVLRHAADVAPDAVPAAIAEPLAAWLRGHADWMELTNCLDRDAVRLALALIDAAQGRGPGDDSS